jgi:hypothetical protein
MNTIIVCTKGSVRKFFNVTSITLNETNLSICHLVSLGGTDKNLVETFNDGSVWSVTCISVEGSSTTMFKNNSTKIIVD